MNRQQNKMKFPEMCRNLRISQNLRQRQVAAALGIKPSSYGNVESANHKTISSDKVTKLAEFYRLDAPRSAELMAAWQELPLSAYSQAQGEALEKRRRDRSKLRGYDRLRRHLVELIGLLIVSVDDPGTLCACEPPDIDGPELEPCELCAALQEVGIGGWTGKDAVVAKLAALQDKSQSLPSSVSA